MRESVSSGRKRFGVEGSQTWTDTEERGVRGGVQGGGGEPGATGTKTHGEGAQNNTNTNIHKIREYHKHKISVEMREEIPAAEPARQ